MQFTINIPDDKLPYYAAMANDRISAQREAALMTLNDFQKLLAPHTLVSLWAGPSLMLWGGEIEACDFDRYGSRIVTAVNLYNRDYYRGFWYTCSLPGSETEGPARGICSACAALRFPHPQLKSRKGKRQRLPAAACFLLFA